MKALSIFERLGCLQGHRQTSLIKQLFDPNEYERARKSYNETTLSSIPFVCLAFARYCLKLFKIANQESAT
jgi:hypothetical protein